ncbi:MAG: TrkA family potassium uptake protein [Planctomycetes bacterium]|nr:TrkA family potassium uptake protein [Planctomycetota bacterium]
MRILIAGGGMVGGQLARRLLENKYDVILIDKDKELCDRMYAETGVVVICGSVTNVDVLKEARMETADVLFAVTVNDADNLACAILAKSFGVKKIVARMRNPEYEKAYKLAGVDTVIRVTDLMVGQMMMEVECPDVQRISSIGDGRVGIFRILISEGGRANGQCISDIAQNEAFPKQCVIGAVFSPADEHFHIPRGNSVLKGGDQVFLVADDANAQKAIRFLTVS